MNIKSSSEFYLYFLFSTKLNCHIAEKGIALEGKITFTSRKIEKFFKEKGIKRLEKKKKE